MTHPDPDMRRISRERNQQNRWFTGGQVSTPFLSFMNNFNPPRAHILALQHYTKIDTSAKIYDRMHFYADTDL